MELRSYAAEKIPVVGSLTVASQIRGSVFQVARDQSGREETSTNRKKLVRLHQSRLGGDIPH